MISMLQHFSFYDSFPSIHKPKPLPWAEKVKQGKALPREEALPLFSSNKVAQREKDEKGWLTSLGHGRELEKAHLQEDRVPALLFLI